MHTRYSFWTVAVVIGALLAGGAQAKSCDAKCLRNTLDRYAKALVSRKPSALPLAGDVKITENGKALGVGEGLWKTASAFGSFREDYVDATTGNALLLAVIDESDASGAVTPAIIATRLKITDGKISEIETIVARKGSHPLFAPELMKRADPLFAAVVPEDIRVPRRRMIEIADAYFDGIEQNSSANIQATPDCNRFENGVKTTFRNATSGNCAKSADNINYIKAVKDRRYYIVDETTGVVACTIIFDIPGGDPVTTPATGSEAQLQTTLRQPRMLLLTELFKIEGGNISRIQAVMQNLPYGSKSGWEK